VIGSLSISHASWIAIINENACLVCLRVDGNDRYPAYIPAIAKHMQRQERDEAVFCSVETAGLIKGSTSRFPKEKLPLFSAGSAW